MKKWERTIVYSIAVFALIYSIWAHGKLQRIYQINRLKPFYPTYSTSSPMRLKGNYLSQLCESVGAIKLAAALKSSSLSEGTRNLLIVNLRFEVEDLNRWNLNTSIEIDKAEEALSDAIKAEIDLLTFERQSFEKDKSFRWYESQVYKSLMDSSVNLRAEAISKIDKLMNKI